MYDTPPIKVPGIESYNDLQLNLSQPCSWVYILRYLKLKGIKKEKE